MPDPSIVITPGAAVFNDRYEQGQPQYVHCRVAGDLDTPVSAYLKLTGGGKNSFLLESVEGGENLGRYSLIGFAPDLLWRAHGNASEVAMGNNVQTEQFTPMSGGAIDALNKTIDEARIPAVAEDRLPPMAGGLFGYFGYDFVRLTENLPNRPPSPFSLPDGYFIRPTMMAVFDNVTREILLITPVRPTKSVSAATAYEAALARLEDATAKLSAPLAPHLAMAAGKTASDFQSNLLQTDYQDKVTAAKELIAAGDIFQVVLSQRFEADFEGDPFALYRRLRRRNPSPFLFYLNFGPATLLGASPEILVRVRDGMVTIRPIAGTRRRGITPDQDKALEEELLADPKERAEHLMLLDLGRNDVGRSAVMGTVTPTETFTIERYSHVMHIVSNVEGRLRPDLTPLDALANGFPAGTLTGAPKVRAMEIIDDLEPEGRGPYGGCIGYFGSDGAVDTCIGLRMAVIVNGRIHIQAGAGIVADSDPEAEYEECLAKAAAMMEAARG